MPSSGLLVSNHLSYLDIIVLSSIQPCVFVAKGDVARWPLFGWLARAAGTIFVDRDRRLSSPNSIDVIRNAPPAPSLSIASEDSRVQKQ
jgi:1-acyl-sn-glycerol-3-phosphate acyltransferase